MAFTAHSLALLLSPPPHNTDGIVVSNRTPLFLRHLRTLLLATVYWFFLTQRTWFLTPGQSVSQRILLYTGGECVPAALSSSQASSGMSDFPVCTGGRGEYYRGGHDVSGHTFILVLSSLLLVDHVTPALLARSRAAREVRWTTYAALALVALWWWMLVATSVYFHTPIEKATGFIFALGGWFVSRL